MFHHLLVSKIISFELPPLVVSSVNPTIVEIEESRIKSIIYKYSIPNLLFSFQYIQARFACLFCAAGGYFVSAGGALWGVGSH